MNEPKYTKGPWTFVEGRKGLNNYSKENADKAGGISGDNYVICEICGDVPEWKANAHLISAAPELLDAVKMGFGLLTGELMPESRERVMELMRAAIAKAEGK